MNTLEKVDKDKRLLNSRHQRSSTYPRCHHKGFLQRQVTWGT